jgi:hypothetical protein
MKIIASLKLLIMTFCLLLLQLPVGARKKNLLVIGSYLKVEYKFIRKSHLKQHTRICVKEGKKTCHATVSSIKLRTFKDGNPPLLVYLGFGLFGEDGKPRLGNG